jgi:hypothetical protein
MQKEEQDLTPRTKFFAREVIRLEADELVAILVSIAKRARGDG